MIALYRIPVSYVRTYHRKRQLNSQVAGLGSMPRVSITETSQDQNPDPWLKASSVALSTDLSNRPVDYHHEKLNLK